MNEDKKKKIIELTKRTTDDFMQGALEGNKGYKFRTRAFLEVIFLYINGVDVGNPDLLGPNNKNTFVNEARSAVEKIKEQIRMDIKDINFEVPGASSLGRFIPKAANRQLLEENDFSETLDTIPDDAADYGSGFLQVWKTPDGKMKAAAIDPFNIIWNQYNFKEGPKIKRIRKSVRQIIANEKYDADARLKLAEEHKENLEVEIILHQTVQDLPDGTQEISIVDYENDEVYYHYSSPEKLIWFFKFDYRKRKGFKDALGIGPYEAVFNKIVQSKVNRERMDEVMEVASKLPFQKQMDNERDNYAGKEVVKLKTSAIIGHKGHEIKPLETGGVKQANLIQAQLGQIISTIGNDLNVGEALEGNTLPSGTSGVLGNLLTENSSSVLKEVKKNYAKFLNIVYKTVWTPYILSIFDANTDLKKYLDPNDIKLIERNVINYLVAQKSIDAAINEEPFDVATATEEVKREIKGKKLISGDLLQQLRDEVQGIRTFISGEKTSKAQSVAFIREIRSTFATNPDLFKQPFFVELLKKEAEYEQGLSGIEIDNLLREIQ